MQEAWIQLACPACDEQWEQNPTDLPEPGTEFNCTNCAETRRVAEFTRTQRDFEILENFHGS